MASRDGLRAAFDIFLADRFFNKFQSQTDLDNDLTSAILERNSQISMNSQEQINLTNLLSKVKIVLENLAFCQSNFNTMRLSEIKEVGSYKKSTMLTNHRTADLVVIVNTWPLKEDVKLLAGKVLFELTRLENLMNLDLIDLPSGFVITQTESCTKVKVLITTFDIIMPDPAKYTEYVDENLINLHMAACRHVRWFEGSVTSTSISLLIKIVKDMCFRFKIAHDLNPWMIDIICHYSFTYRNPGIEDYIRQPHLPLATAFKRLIQIIASGILLPDQAGIIDICEPYKEPIHTRLTIEQQDKITSSFQTLLRMLPYPDGYRSVLGLKENIDYSQLLINNSEWKTGDNQGSGIVIVKPSQVFVTSNYNVTELSQTLSDPDQGDLAINTSLESEDLEPE